MILWVFEAICKDIKKNETKIDEKVRFIIYSNDKIAATKNIVRRYVGCDLSESEYSKLSELLTAFFRTGDPRKKIDNEFKQRQKG